MISFEFTDEQKQLRALMREVGEKETTRKKMDELADKVSKAKTVEEVRALQPIDIYKKFHQVGLRQLAVPEKYGGGGMGFAGHVTRALISEQAGYTTGLGARLLGMEWRHCAAMCAVPDSEKEKDWFFSKLMGSDNMLTAGCHSEPEGTFVLEMPYEPKVNPGSVGKVTAIRDGDEWIINGNKMFSSGSGVAGLFHVGTRADKKLPLSQCEEFFWIEQGTPGVTYIPNNFCADEISGNFQTFFDNVRVPESRRIKAKKWASYCAASKHLFITAILGDAQYIYDWLVDYTKQRMAGSIPLIRHTHIAAMLGKLSYQLEAARSFCYRGAWELDQAQLAGKPLDTYWCRGSYALVKKASWDLCETTAEIIGGIVSAVDLPAEAFMRRTYVWHGGGGGGPTTNYIEGSMMHNHHKIGEYGWGEGG